MSIFPDKKVIFISIPKTAGTSIETYLSNYATPLGGEYKGVLLNTGHASCGDMLHCGLWFSDYFKFTFVRNPWDRLVSAFVFLNAGGVNQEDELLRQRFLAKYDGDFDSFVVDFVNPENMAKVMHFRPQHTFICDASSPAVDFVGRFEQLEEDFAIVCERIGIPTGDLPHLVQSRHGHYTEYYTPKTRDAVARVYARDIDIFGYDFVRQS